MPILSSAAWVVHDVGLATSIGGAIFGKAALEPSLEHISDPGERDRVADAAWRRFSWLNLAAHAAVAVSWFAGRQMLTGREVSGTARSLTVTKDALVVASLATGVTSIVLGRLLGKRTARQRGPAEVAATEGATPREPEAKRTRAVERAVDSMGIANLLCNMGTAAVTTILSMQASESARFVPAIRRMP